MEFPKKIWLPIITSGAIALSACSSSRASETDNNVHFSENGFDGLGNDMENQGADLEGEDLGPPMSLDDPNYHLPATLCLEAARRRFGVETNGPNSSVSSIGGNTPQTFRGDIEITLPGPPARRFRCELNRGAVVSVAEDDAADPVTILR